MSNILLGVQQCCQKTVIELPRREANETHLVIQDDDDLVRLCAWAREQDYYFCTLVVNDERVLEDYTFKLYYVFSAPKTENEPANRLVILEHALRTFPRQPGYPTIRPCFPAVEGLEREALDMLGLSPHTEPAPPGSALHQPPYPPEVYPLRRRRSQTELIENRINKNLPASAPLPPPLPEGLLELPVGPIHAGIIEAGRFNFQIAGEVIEKVVPRLGYKHRGIEKLFETQYTLDSGWRLAERVAGDSSFAHSMAYCQAVEAIAGVTPPEPALYWRGLCLELERICNHINDVAALAHDIAFDLAAAPLAVLREKAVRLNDRLTGSRFLRGVNRPGGVQLARVPDLNDVQTTITQISTEFLDLGKLFLEMPACRERTISTGVLSRAEVRALGATGLPARASGLWRHDFRLLHPQGAYLNPRLTEIINQTILKDEVSPSDIFRAAPVFESDLQGDVFARLAMRVAEVETSSRLVVYLADVLLPFNLMPLNFVTPVLSKLKTVTNFDFGLGYAEGWRGEIFYFVIKGPDNSIFRCKVRDPSLFNWPALAQAIRRKPQVDSKGKPAGHWENILADFPLINKSFNLSYSGHDL